MLWYRTSKMFLPSGIEWKFNRLYSVLLKHFQEIVILYNIQHIPQKILLYDIFCCIFQRMYISLYLEVFATVHLKRFWKPQRTLTVGSEILIVVQTKLEVVCWAVLRVTIKCWNWAFLQLIFKYWTRPRWSVPISWILF